MIRQINSKRANRYEILFAEFRSGKAPILVATDVASRGLGK